MTTDAAETTIGCWPITFVSRDVKPIDDDVTDNDDDGSSAGYYRADF